MHLNRFFAAAAALCIAVLPARADQNLGAARIQSGTNKLVLPGGPMLGTYQNGKFSAQPDAIQIQGPGSTGDVSGTSVPSPSTSAPAGTLSNLMANRLLLLGNDVTANPDSSVTDKIPFANTGSKHFLYSRRNAPASALLGTTTLVRNTVGSGTFGPGSADFAVLTSTTKDNWQTETGAAAREGELDTLISIARQGKKGDTAAYVGDVLKRRDNLTSVASDESGAPIILEGGVGLVDASGNQYLSFHSLLGFIESPTGLSGGRGYGEVQEARIGTGWSAHHASAVSSSAGWMYYYTGAQARDPSSLNYLVDNAGRTTVGFASARMSWGFDATANAYTLLDAVGGTERMRVVRDGGGATFTGQHGGLTFADPVTGGANGGYQRFVSAGNGNYYWQVANSAAAFGPGGTAFNAYHVAPDASLNMDSLFKLKAYTVSTLPACNAVNRDSLAVVSDAAAPAYRGALTGGGTVRTPVYCDGSIWTAQ